MMFRPRSFRNSISGFLPALTLVLSGCGGGSGSEGPGIPWQAGPAAPARSFSSASNEVERGRVAYKILHTFGQWPDAEYPVGGLKSAYGTLFGTTIAGGTNFNGTVFTITTAGAENVLYSFGNPPDAAYSAAGLIHVGGTFYGTTAFGGAGGFGTVFSVTAAGQESVLYSFKGGADGAYPVSGLIDVGGTLYGTTNFGGSSGHCDQGCGTVFSVTTAGQESVIHTFKGGMDGDAPIAGLRNVSGKLYGVTEHGGTSGSGCYRGCGTVFAITTGGQHKTIYRFKGGSDGWLPESDLTDIDGALYGTTYDGGGSGCQVRKECGTVFKITTSGEKSVLYKFKGQSDGSGPVGGLLAVNGTLYGTTEHGGGSERGTVFKLTTGGRESVLHRFQGPEDGTAPTAGLIEVEGTLYGTTERGGENFEGTVFSIRP